MLASASWTHLARVTHKERGVVSLKRHQIAHYVNGPVCGLAVAVLTSAVCLSLSRSQEADVPASSGAPENLTFKERQRLFSQGQDVSNKVKASRKLTELENELNTK